jgi:hypothetical protein
MKRVASLGIVVLLCGVGLQGGVTLPVQQEGLSHLLYEPKSPLARNHKLLQLVTEADHALQLSSGAWGSMLIHDEWSELIGWLAIAPGRKPKDFKQRCVALRNFIQQSPEVDPVVSAAVLKALACIMRTYTGMSVGAKVGIGVGVAVTALTALAAFAKLHGRVPNPRSAVLGGGAPAGGAPESGATGLGHIPGTGGGLRYEDELAIVTEESLRSNPPVGGFHEGSDADHADDDAAMHALLEAEAVQNTRAALELLQARGRLVKKLRSAIGAPSESVQSLEEAFRAAEERYNSVGGISKTRDIFAGCDSVLLLTSLDEMYRDIQFPRSVGDSGVAGVAGEGSGEGSSA